LRAQIETDLDLSELATMMPSWMPDAVNRLATLDDKRPITGWRDPSVMVGNLPSQYAPIMDAFLQDPNRLALRNYARWWFDQRAAAAPLAACDNLNPIACQAVETQLGIGARPWPWDLTDPFTLAEYLDWALANGLVMMQPAPIPTSPPSSPDGIPGGGPLYPLSIHIVDATGTALPGACVEVVLALGTSTICDNQEGDTSPVAGVIEVQGSPWTYTVREIQAPSGYALVEGIRTVEVTSAGGSVVLVHTPGASNTDGPAATPRSSAPTTSQTTGIEGQTYTSPQFGYVVTWEAPWEPDAATSDPQGGDYLRLSTGEIAMEYQGISTDQPIEQALEAFVAERARAHPGAVPQYQAPGGGLNADSPALWSFDYTRADGVVMGEATIAFSVGSGQAVVMRTVTRPVDDASPRALFYAVALFLDPLEATAAAQQAIQQPSEQGNSSSSGSHELRTLAGRLRLTDSFVVASDGTCTGAGAFRDVGPGLPITVANVVDVVIVTGWVVGVGTPVASLTGNGQDCLFTFNIANVPVQPFYRISVGQYIERDVVDQATLEANNWTIEFVL
ncbi:MAG: prealbumin-like fold domain-containing protein, partial [Chloroflexota bacterium]|nr:prealbumin-like fold domain-containing protein [Chloroflexota bacterium]